MVLYSYIIILIIVCAVFYYRAGELENTSGLLWAGLSILTSIIVWLLLHGGFWTVLLGQVALFVGITVYRCVKDQEPPSE